MKPDEEFAEFSSIDSPRRATESPDAALYINLRVGHSYIAKERNTRQWLSSHPYLYSCNIHQSAVQTLSHAHWPLHQRSAHVGCIWGLLLATHQCCTNHTHILSRGQHFPSEANQSAHQAQTSLCHHNTGRKNGRPKLWTMNHSDTHRAIVPILPPHDLLIRAR